MASFLQRFVLWCLLFSVIASLQWAPRPRNGEVIYACEGEDVTIPWDFTLTAGEDITSIEWLFRGASQEIVAMYSHATFIPLPAFSDRVQRVASGGLILRHVTTADAGNFTIEVNGKQNTVIVFESRKVVLQVNDGLQTTDRQLHATLQPDAILDPASQQWSIVLSCGQFTYAGQPAFPVEWVTPSGAVLPSSSYANGYFNLHLANGLQGGSYICRVPQQHTSSACLQGNQNTTAQASVKVDGVEVRILLMEAELRSLRSQNQQNEQDKLQLKQGLDMVNNTLAENVNNLSRQFSEVDTLVNSVDNRVNDLTIAHQKDNASLNRLIQDMATPLIAFNAWHSFDQRLSPPTHVKFDTVLYNQGGAFNSTTGDFTAPVSGAYVFYFHTRSHSSYAHTYMKVNGNTVCTAYIQSSDKHGSCMAVVSMNAGDRLWVEPHSNNMYYTVYTTSFTGFLLSHDIHEH